MSRGSVPVTCIYSLSSDALNWVEHRCHVILVRKCRGTSVVDFNGVPHLLVGRSNIIITILLQGIAAVDTRVNSSQRSEGRVTSLVLRRCLVRGKRAPFTRRTSSHRRSISNSISHGSSWLGPPIEGNSQELPNVKNPLPYKTFEYRL